MAWGDRSWKNIPIVNNEGSNFLCNEAEKSASIWARCFGAGAVALGCWQKPLRCHKQGKRRTFHGDGCGLGKGGKRSKTQGRVEKRWSEKDRERSTRRRTTVQGGG